MRASTRRAIAYVAALLAGSRPSSIIELSDGTPYHFSGSVHGSAVSAYDFAEHSHISGTRRNGKVSLFHFGNHAHIELSMKPTGDFSGFDFDTGSHFAGSVKGRNVTLYDHGEGAHFTYAA